MADFCKDHSILMFGKDYRELAGLCAAGEYVASVICEACDHGGHCIVDHEGVCVVYRRNGGDIEVKNIEEAKTRKITSVEYKPDKPWVEGDILEVDANDKIARWIGLRPLRGSGDDGAWITPGRQVIIKPDFKIDYTWSIVLLTAIRPWMVALETEPKSRNKWRIKLQFVDDSDRPWYSGYRNTPMEAIVDATMELIRRGKVAQQ